MGKINKYLLITLLVPLLVAFSQARLLSAANCDTISANHHRADYHRADYHHLGRQSDTPPCCAQDLHQAACCSGNMQRSLADSNSTAESDCPPSHFCRNNKHTEVTLAAPALQAKTPATLPTSSIIAPVSPHSTTKLIAWGTRPPPPHASQQRHILHCSFLI